MLEVAGDLPRVPAKFENPDMCLRYYTWNSNAKTHTARQDGSIKPGAKENDS